MRRLRSAFLAFFLAGCGFRRDQLEASLDQHDLGAAKRMHDEALDAPNGGPPPSEHWNTSLLLLDRGMIRAAQSDFTGASQDLAAADKMIDGADIVRTKRMRNLKNPQGFLYMYQRGWSQALNMPIGLKFYERLLLNPFAALSRLEASDANGACVEGRRYGVVDEWTDSVAKGRAASVRRFGELVTAVACHAAGDDALACASWNRASADPRDAVLEGRCAHAAAVATSDLWVFVAYGRASHPYWKQEKSGKVVDIAGGPETMAANDLAVTVDGRSISAREALDIEAEARADYAESKTAIEVTVLGVKGRTGEWSPISWTVLPAHVGLARATVGEGSHEVRIRVRGQEVRRSVSVVRGRPGVAFVYVPW